MINFLNSNFFTPNKELRQLSILFAIYRSPKISQHTIGKITCLSSSMVNNYIKSLTEQGLIRVNGETNRTQSYHLTPDGQKILLQSLLTYSAEIVQLYAAVKNEIASILKTFHAEGIEKVILFGIADTAEVVYAAIKETPLILTDVVDSDINKHGKKFNGFIIKSPKEIIELKPDAVIITSFAKQEEIYKEIKKIVGEKIKIKKLSDLQEIA